MTPKLLFYIIIGILVFNYTIHSILDYLNAKHFNDEIPEPLKDVYSEDEYKKSQAYKKENDKFSNISGLFSLTVTLLFFFFKGFAYVDELARRFSDHELIVGLIFFGIIMIASSIISLPFSYYHTFVIEEKYGFNKSSKKLFWIDKIKGLLVSSIIGGLILLLIIWFYLMSGSNFWIYAWIFVALFSIFMTLFYSSLIVPLFNKQKPLEEGNLKSKIDQFAEKVGFTVNDIYVIDGSKRSSKANAYFFRLWSQKENRFI